MIRLHGKLKASLNYIVKPFLKNNFLKLPDNVPGTILNMSGDSQHHHLIPDFRGKDFRFSLFSMMLAIGLYKGLSLA